MSLLFSGVRVLDAASPQAGAVVDVVVKHGRIIALGEALPEADTRNAYDVLQPFRDAAGTDAEVCISPGWVDLFADYREPGYESKETVQTGLQAAAAGGFTAVCTLPNTFPVRDSRTAVEWATEKGRGAPTLLLPMGAVSKGLEGASLAEMIDMHRGGAVAFTDGWKPVQNRMLLLKALEYVKAFSGTVIQMPMDASLAAGGLMHEGPMSTALGLASSPALAETVAVTEALQILHYTGSRLHLTGISTEGSVEAIRRAKAEGLRITCSCTPYHLALTDASLHDYDSVYKVSPPLREERDRQALIAGLADGTIDAIASHHRPHEWDAKAKEFEYAGDGMAVQEIAFSVALQGVGSAVPLPRLADALGAAPRRALGLESASIAADGESLFTIFTAGGATSTATNTLRSLARNHPFVDAALPGCVLGFMRGAHLHLNYSSDAQ